MEWRLRVDAVARVRPLMATHDVSRQRDRSTRPRTSHVTLTFTRLPTSLLSVLLVAYTVLCFLGALATGTRVVLRQAQDALGSARHLHLDDAIVVQRLVGVADPLCRVAIGITFCIWIYLAHRNLRAFGVRYLRFTPGWAVGWFFIPVANLFRPVQVMAELWRASGPDTSLTGRRPHSASGTAVLAPWWASYLVMANLHALAYRYPTASEYAATHLSVQYLWLATWVSGAIASITGTRLVRTVSRRQAHRAVELEASLPRPSTRWRIAWLVCAVGALLAVIGIMARLYPRRHVEMGALYLALGGRHRAVVEFQRALRCDPRDLDAYWGLGAAYGELGEWTEAARAFEHAVLVEPQNAVSHYNIGIAYGEIGRYQDASCAYQSAIDLDPLMVDARINLGLTYVELDRVREALDVFQKAASIAPGDPDVQYELGVLLVQMGQESKARDQLAIVERLDPVLAAKLAEIISHPQAR